MKITWGKIKILKIQHVKSLLASQVTVIHLLCISVFMLFQIVFNPAIEDFNAQEVCHHADK